MLFILIGFTGLSRLVFTFEMAVTTSMPDSTFPNTGCLEGPGENQSRLALLATLMKNCEPPELGLPVLAIESVKGALVSREMFSSSMFPPFFRVSVAPVFRFLKVPSAGPPVPDDVGDGGTVLEGPRSADPMGALTFGSGGQCGGGQVGRAGAGLPAQHPAHHTPL